MNLRSRQQGSIRVFLKDEGALWQESTEKETASWKGRRQEFSKVRMAVKKDGGKERMSGDGTGRTIKSLKIVLQGDAELESFSFEVREKQTYDSFSEKIKKMPYGGITIRNNGRRRCGKKICGCLSWQGLTALR